MIKLFQYNWQVREEWFDWCEQLPKEEVFRPRAGGVGSVYRTLFHIVDVEQAWVNGLRGNPEFHYNAQDYPTLKSVRELSDECKPSVREFVIKWDESQENNKLAEFTHGDIMRHVIAHEIHHIGQLSIWARHLGFTPITANLLWRDL